jgi:hypothetical protein
MKAAKFGDTFDESGQVIIWKRLMDKCGGIWRTVLVGLDSSPFGEELMEGDMFGRFEDWRDMEKK